MFFNKNIDHEIKKEFVERREQKQLSLIDLAIKHADAVANDRKDNPVDFIFTKTGLEEFAKEVRNTYIEQANICLLGLRPPLRCIKAGDL